MAYADKRNSPAVIIEGTQEREQGIVQIKDLIAGKEAAKAITDNAEWKAERPGQFECTRRRDRRRNLGKLPAVARLAGRANGEDSLRALRGAGAPGRVAHA